MLARPCRQVRQSLEFLPVLRVRLSGKGAARVVADELGEALDLEAVAHEDVVGSAARLPVEVDEHQRPVRVRPREAEIVLDELIGIEEVELRCVVEHGEPSRRRSRVVVLAQFEIARGDRAVPAPAEGFATVLDAGSIPFRVSTVSPRPS